ncbi:zinc finger protein 660-like [Chaetodon trifascialis]|uniref:zinc finger protein 660-like n=1 Tax=Chaetodon trifascialis TaxID=109706 RepID=UPI0039930D5C
MSRKLLDAVFQPEVRLHRADVQLLSASPEEDPPEQQDWSPRLDQEDPAELPHIKEEQEELWSSQEGEQLPGPKEADITKSTVPPVPVKSEEEDEEKPQSDVQLLSASPEEDPPEQQDWSPCLDQEDPAELPHIKEEQEELWSSQEGEQLPGPKEADITKSTVPPVPVKSEEEDEEKPQSSQLHQRHAEDMRTEAGGEDCGGPEADSEDETSQSSDPETDDSCDWEETRGPQSGLKSLQNNEVPVSDVKCNTGQTSVSSSECASSFDHSGVQTAETLFSCSVCGKSYQRKKSLRHHMTRHSEGKRFSCSVCQKTFPWRVHVVTHMRIHTGEKPFSCSVCGDRFTQKQSLRRHSTVHTGEKPFNCFVCGLRFREKSNLKRHSSVHRREKPLGCSVCGKRYDLKRSLRNHMKLHSEGKRFSCSVCEKTFQWKKNMVRHMRVHTGETPFSCSVVKD